MDKPRDFIEETIDLLDRAKMEIQYKWQQFKDGHLTKDEFEESYKHWLYNVKEVAEHEYYTPNNGCKYF